MKCHTNSVSKENTGVPHIDKFFQGTLASSAFDRCMISLEDCELAFDCQESSD
jgi:hypothetical protein